MFDYFELCATSQFFHGGINDIKHSLSLFFIQMFYLRKSVMQLTFC